MTWRCARLVVPATAMMLVLVGCGSGSGSGVASSVSRPAQATTVPGRTVRPPTTDGGRLTRWPAAGGPDHRRIGDTVSWHDGAAGGDGRRRRLPMVAVARGRARGGRRGDRRGRSPASVADATRRWIGASAGPGSIVGRRAGPVRRDHHSSGRPRAQWSAGCRRRCEQAGGLDHDDRAIDDVGTGTRRRCGRWSGCTSRCAGCMRT